MPYVRLDTRHTPRYHIRLNDLIQASIGDAMVWSNMEDAEVVKSLNGQIR
jgi:hypothetical protein